LLKDSDVETGNSTAQLQRLMLDFSKLGANIVMVDRQTGLCFDHRLKRV